MVTCPTLAKPLSIGSPHHGFGQVGTPPRHKKTFQPDVQRQFRQLARLGHLKSPRKAKNERRKLRIYGGLILTRGLENVEDPRIVRVTTTMRMRSCLRRQVS